MAHRHVDFAFIILLSNFWLQVPARTPSNIKILTWILKKWYNPLTGLKLCSQCCPEYDNTLGQIVVDSRMYQMATFTTWETCLEKIRRFFSIDYYMLPSKLAFLIRGACNGHTMYITVFLTSVGLTSSEAGLITGVSFIGSALAGPAWGMIADYTRKQFNIFDSSHMWGHNHGLVSVACRCHFELWRHVFSEKLDRNGTKQP